LAGEKELIRQNGFKLGLIQFLRIQKAERVVLPNQF
jgi:hypothetical protein